MSASFSDPRSNVLQLGLHEGMKVADFGSGPGHYARAAAAVVGHSGKVYAIDVQEDVLTHAALHESHRRFGPIEGLWGDIEKPGGSHLRDHSVDAVILSNTLFQLADRAAALAEIARVLKPEGKLLVVDWAGSYGGMGPSSERVVPEHEAEALFIGAGFHKVKAFRAGGHHYALVFSL